MRAVDGVSILSGRRLALHLMVQPDAAAGFLADGMLRDQGLLSRILVAAPQSIAGTRLYREVRPEDDFAIKTYGARLLACMEAPLPLAENKRNELAPPALELTSEAAAIWRQFYDHVEEQCGKGRGLSGVQDFAAKVAEHAARIAGVLTIIEEEEPQEIGAAAMSSATALADWYLSEAQRLQQAARLDPKLLLASKLLDWMRETGEQEIHFRDVLRLGPSGVRLKSAAEEALKILLAHGWISEVAGRPRRFRLHKGAS
ncbi:DUF3987 domain-containing protein [Antarcticirhabdus aurantiaca]|uniref:DUF3987 domain-containing protein n=1 Tax=Antarcticirhabdus aurantiaca TaxID=2606717 RepID=A0ACD4NQ13_9HYPH|nr:DUF3987 domain-containing protein [Jeongeuplla avenae]